jgi:hypothetical protein
MDFYPFASVSAFVVASVSVSVIDFASVSVVDFASVSVVDIVSVFVGEVHLLVFVLHDFHLTKMLLKYFGLEL